MKGNQLFQPISLPSFVDKKKKGKYHMFASRYPNRWASQVVLVWVRFLGREDPLEKGMLTHSSILAWRLPWTEETGGLQSMGLQRVRHDWSNLAHTHIQIGASWLDTDYRQGSCKADPQEWWHWCLCLFPAPFIPLLSLPPLFPYSLPGYLNPGLWSDFGLLPLLPYLDRM